MVSMDSKGDVSEESCLGLDLHDAIMNRIIVRTRIWIRMKYEKVKRNEQEKQTCIAWCNNKRIRIRMRLIIIMQ